MAEHDLKCSPEPFAALITGAKTHEFRRDDRGFQVGDVLRLREWDPTPRPWRGDIEDDRARGYTGRELRRRVTYISRGPDWGIPPGYVVMSLAELGPPIGKVVAVHDDGAVSVALGFEPTQPEAPRSPPAIDTCPTCGTVLGVRPP